MKYFKFMMMVVCLVFSQSILAQTNNGSGTNNGTNTGGNTGNPGLNGDGPTWMELWGECESDIPRSTVLPFEAYIQDEVVYVTGLSDMEDVTVQIVSSTGMVYFCTTKSFIFLETYGISISGFASGDYTLYISTPRGTSIYGRFRI